MAPEVRFCSTCGAGLTTGPPVTCGICGTSHWLNPKPCANAIIVRDDKVLLTRRAHPPWKDGWCAPGGFCEIGEHPIETAEREVLEETGLQVRVAEYIGVWVNTYANDPAEPDAAVINVAYYRAVPLEGVESAFDPREVSELRWFDWEDLPSGLAPPGTLAEVLAAVRTGAAHPDRPG